MTRFSLKRHAMLDTRSLFLSWLCYSLSPDGCQYWRFDCHFCVLCCYSGYWNLRRKKARKRSWGDAVSWTQSRRVHRTVHDDRWVYRVITWARCVFSFFVFVLVLWILVFERWLVRGLITRSLLSADHWESGQLTRCERCVLCIPSLALWTVC